VLRGHDKAVLWAAWSHDGKRIVTASEDTTARVWNADGSGTPVVLRGNERVLFYAAFSPDGARIITSAFDEIARVWNADGSGEPYILNSHGAGVAVAAWSLDGTRMVAREGAGENMKIAWVWPLLAPLRGTDDPRLWTATSYCMSVERRIAMLSVPEARARADQDACERRVQAAGKPFAGGTDR
jgi:WD40 repeat protein